MAGDWIKLEVATIDKPEVLKLAALLGKTHGDALLLCIKFWVWADKNCNDSVTHVYAQLIDNMMQTPGFARALEAVGWLEIPSEMGDTRIPNFARHNGKPAKTRALTRDRVIRFRNDDVTPTKRERNAHRVNREEKSLKPNPTLSHEPPISAAGRTSIHGELSAKPGTSTANGEGIGGAAAEDGNPGSAGTERKVRSRPRATATSARDNGTNPRATGSNPRAKGINGHDPLKLGQWWLTEHTQKAAAKALGLPYPEGKMGEDADTFRARIAEAIAERKRTH